MTEPLHVKYRPQVLEDVIGQDAVVKNLARLFEAKRVPHTFLFTGSSGVGKTTIARILASMLGASMIEVDAARFSGIDAMRTLLNGTQYAALGDSPKKFYIIDEAHALSRAAFQTLLLSTEEPPEHLFWALCTTEPDKVPTTIRTRSHTYDLKPVKWDLLAEYLDFVRIEEKLKVVKEFVDLAARKANGSVRQALVFLSLLDGITDKAEALRLVEDAEAIEEGPIVLARMIISGRGFTWSAARKIIEDLSDTSPETIRLTVLNYASSALLKENGEKQAVKLMSIVQAFSQPCNQSEKMAPILIAVGSLLFGGE
jgi:DNA polymerase III gamma/tau subunit